MAFKGRGPVRSNNVKDIKIIEELSFFNYVGNWHVLRKNWTLIN